MRCSLLALSASAFVVLPGSAKPCTSPLTLKRLKKGKHTFSVFATDAAGNLDPTPATGKFKVKRRKR